MDPFLLLEGAKDGDREAEEAAMQEERFLALGVSSAAVAEEGGEARWSSKNRG